ncbi:MAG: S8 family serine peptidase [Frankiales bacterium]|nr:S8 family serine peptidase [Frankiales bacterium]
MKRTGSVAIAAVLAAATVLALPAGAANDQQDTWHARQAQIPQAQAAGRDGAGVLVAVLDSWVDRDHPDFGGRVLAGADCAGGSCRPGPASSDQCDHGTHVSGTVASSSFGVAPRARVLPVRVLTYDPASGECTGEPADVAAGIRWAVAQGAQVLNLSLGPDVHGLSSSTTIAAAVTEAAAAGAVVIFSAGNANVPVADEYGSSALIVAATGPSGALASYSQRGTGVDLAAPGGDPRTPGVCTREECVTSLYPGGRYSVAAGTSMAAPHVSGIAALLLAQEPSRTRQQVIDRLLSTASPLAGAGSGLVNARAALGIPAVPAARAGNPPRPVTIAPAAPAPPTSSPGRSPRPTPTTSASPAATTTPAPAVVVPAVVALPAQQPVVRSQQADPPAPVPTPLAGLAAALALVVGGGAAYARRVGR